MTRHLPKPGEAATLLFVIDSDNGWPADGADREPIIDWLRRNDLDPRNTHRLEIWSALMPYAKVFQYATDRNGKRYCPHRHDHHDGHSRCEMAERAPFIVYVRTDFPLAEEILRSNSNPFTEASDQPH